MPNRDLPLRWLGLDVSKASFHGALSTPEWRQAPIRSFPRTPAGARDFLSWARWAIPEAPLGVVMEATGAYSKPLARWLIDGSPGVQVSIANPLQVKHFALGQGIRNKTDAQDARMLARFGTTNQPVAFHPMPEAYEELQALCRERAALVKSRTAAENRDELPSPSKAAQKVRRQVLRQLEKAVESLDAAIAAHIQAHPDLKRDFDLMCSAPGIGPVVASTLMGELGDLRAFPEHKRLTGYVGLNPVHKDSGTSLHTKPHLSKQGNPRVRKMLYMAALSASRGDHDLGDTYRHLLTEGKAPMAALGAVMRKILVILWAILQRGESFDPHHTRDINQKKAHTA
ncbi:MAG: IS110 family transposase [Acidobacteriota bacterium]|nr:IS110 family transposase [Acidobacteriota bacterium]